MNDLLQSWMRLPLRWRLSGLLGLSLLLLLLAWLLLLRPQQQRLASTAQQLAQLAQQLAQLAQQIQQRQQQLLAQPTAGVLESEIAALQQPALGSVPPLTLEAILAGQGDHLESWQPDSQPQQLQLRLHWDQFLPLLSALASTRLAVPQRFELRAEQGLLNTQLWLEHDDAE